MDGIRRYLFRKLMLWYAKGYGWYQAILLEKLMLGYTKANDGKQAVYMYKIYVIL